MCQGKSSWLSRGSACRRSRFHPQHLMVPQHRQEWPLITTGCDYKPKQLKINEFVLILHVKLSCFDKSPSHRSDFDESSHKQKWRCWLGEENQIQELQGIPKCSVQATNVLTKLERWLLPSPSLNQPYSERAVPQSNWGQGHFWANKIIEIHSLTQLHLTPGDCGEWGMKKKTRPSHFPLLWNRRMGTATERVSSMEMR